MNSNTQHTPGQWHTGAGPSKYVFIPGNAKPINAGAIDRAAFIVTACNAHDDLVAALRALDEAGLLRSDSALEHFGEVGRAVRMARAALAKVQS